MALELRVFDNDGKTFDRYTAIFDVIDVDGLPAPESWYLGMSEHPFHPQGFGQHGEGDVSGTINRDREITFEDVPADVQRCIRQDVDAWFFSTLSLAWPR